MSRIGAAVLALWLAAGAAEAENARFSFAVLGRVRPSDSGRDAIGPGAGFVDLLRRAAASHPEFVVVAGEAVGGSAEPDLLELQWDAFERAAARAPGAVRVVPGTRDAAGGAAAAAWERRRGAWQ